MAIVQNIKVPLLSVNDSSLTVTEISNTNGSAVKKGDLLMVFETSKTTYDVIAEGDGFVQYNCVAGDDYEVNQIVAVIFSTSEEVENRVAQPIIARATDLIIANKELSLWTGEILFSKKAQALIDERKVDKSLFSGMDFVTLASVQEVLGIAIPSSVSSSALVPEKKVTKSAVDEKKVVLSKVNGAKKKEIEYLSEVQVTGLTSTVNMYMETEGIFENINSGLKYFKSSFLPVVIYESGRLLRKYPILNSYFTDNKIAIYKEVNIGFAIDIDKGLKVVRINKADTSTLLSIEEQMLELSGKYIDDKLDFSDLSDITFTITDLSAEGVYLFRPLVNRLNSSILGISSVDPKLKRCMLSLSFDHRVTEGKAASRFLSELKERIESYKGDVEQFRVHDTKCYKCFRTMSEDLGDVGFIKCITPKGQDAFICESCLKGF